MTTKTLTREQGIDAMLASGNDWNGLTAAFLLQYPTMPHMEARRRAMLVIQGKADLPEEMR